MNTPMPADDVPAGSDGVDASTLPEAHFQGMNVGAMFGLMVGSGAPPTAVVTPPPFPDCDSYTLVRPFNADQLRDELVTSLKRSVLISTNLVDGTTPSDANPVTLWVSPSGLDSFTINNTITNHEPVSDYNTSAANKAFAAVLQKIAGNENITLSPAEQNTLLVGLGLDYLSRQKTNIQPSFTPSTSTT